MSVKSYLVYGPTPMERQSKFDSMMVRPLKGLPFLPQFLSLHIRVFFYFSIREDTHKKSVFF